jgi:hypothetical protein
MKNSASDDVGIAGPSQSRKPTLGGAVKKGGARKATQIYPATMFMGDGLVEVTRQTRRLSQASKNAVINKLGKQAKQKVATALGASGRAARSRRLSKRKF